MTARERLRRIAAAHKLAFDAAAPGNVLPASLDYAFNPAWVAHLADKPGHVVPPDGLPAPAPHAPASQGSRDMPAHLARTTRPHTVRLTLAAIQAARYGKQ